MRPSTVLSLLLFITTGLLAFSASGQSTWRRTYGASGSDNGASVISCSDGGFLVAGSTGSFGGGAGDVYLLRLDDGGTLLWSRYFGGPDVDHAVACAEVDGGFVIACTVGDGQHGSYDMRLLRTSDTGDVLWSVDYGDADWDLCRGMVVLADGFLLHGVAYSEAVPQGAGVAIRVDWEGDLVWSYAQETPFFTEFNGAAVRMDGTIALAGRRTIVEGDDDGLLLLLDAEGAQLWEATWTASADVSFGDVAAGSNGNLVVCGRSRVGSAAQKIMLAGYDGAGGILWDRYIGNDTDAGATAIQRAHGSGFVITGFTTVGSNSDMILTRVAEDGGFISGSNYGEGNRSMGLGVDSVPGEGYVAAGWIEGSGPGPRAVFVVKTDEVAFTASNTITTFMDPVGIADPEVSARSFVYPNPVSSGSLLSIGAAQETRTWELISMVGSIVSSGTLTAGQKQITLPGLRPGLYELVIWSDHRQQECARLLVE